MTEPSFWTPIKYENISGYSFYNFVEAYFNWSGREVAHVIPSDKNSVILSRESPSWLTTVVKIGFTAAIFVIARKGYERCAPKFHPAFLAMGMVPLLLLISKIYFRLSHKFNLINLQANLAKSLPEVEKLRDVISTNKELFKEPVGWHGKRTKKGDFRLDDPNYSHLIFRVFNSEERAKSYFQNTLQAERVRLLKDLDRIDIPRAVIFYDFTLDAHVIVQEHVDTLSDAQKKYWFNLLDNESLRQMIVLIAKVGFDNISWKNNPSSNGRVTFLDTASVGNPVVGIIGDQTFNRDGLVSCNREKIGYIFQEARRQGIAVSQDLEEITRNHWERRYGSA